MDNTISNERRYRKAASNLIEQINEARSYLKVHKPSLGSFGEFLLMNTLSHLLPNDYEVSQGFVVDYTNDKWISNQCDIIIHRKYCGIVRIFGYTKLIDVKYVDAVIEVKSTISKKTFHSTLKAFERLASKGVVRTFIFVYGKLTRRSLSNWLFSYPEVSTDTSIMIGETSKFDWPDKEWLPKGITSLYNNTFYSLSHIQTVNNDCIGYLSYNIHDNEDRTLSSLQEFLYVVAQSISIDFGINTKRYSLKNGIPLFQL